MQSATLLELAAYYSVHAMTNLAAVRPRIHERTERLAAANIHGLEFMRTVERLITRWRLEYI